MNKRMLSKTMSHALRHEPWLYELELDDEGWVAIEVLLDALRGRSGWAELARGDLERVIETSDKRRFEIEGERIRALYGHSLPGRLRREAARPPERLFHGTSPAAAEIIRQEGLAPMGRQYVHLSVDVETAMAVGRRKAEEPVLLVVAAASAHDDGVAFYAGNDKVWLADVVPAAFLSVDDG